MSHWWLYLFFFGQGPIEVPGHFDTYQDCKAAGRQNIADFKRIHKTAAAFSWCIQGGKDDHVNE